MHQLALEKIEAMRSRINEVNKNMWNNPEGPYKEFKAQAWTAELLQSEGFEVELGHAGVPTSIRASFGKGHPVIGFLGEYDALPGLSQQEGCDYKAPIEGQMYGHGCGHNLLGLAHVAAVIGMKAEMIEKNLSGTIVYYGCPAEEAATGKGFMARGGAFRELDCAVQFHPGKATEVNIGVMSAVNIVEFHFKGRTAHAAAEPYNGRSALDAVELTNVGCNYLREHVPSDVRMHYIITDGGTAANVVPDKASVLYIVRAQTREATNDAYNRMVKVAEGAAHMTETEVEVEFKGGCYNTNGNRAISEILVDALKAVPQDTWTEEEITFAKKLNESPDTQYKSMQDTFHTPDGVQLHYGVLDGVQNRNRFGSSDVGDVMHLIPCTKFTTTTANLGAPGHSWHMTACSGNSIGEKGMTYAARAMAYWGLELINKPEVLVEAKKEFEESMKNREYICPIPAQVQVPK